MTNQEIFNIVWRGLESQGWQPSLLADTDMCAYRGTHQRKCAIGWLIPDDKYDPFIEGCPISVLLMCAREKVACGPAPQTLVDLLVASGVLEDAGDEATLQLLADLQKAHDYPEESGEQRKQRLRAVALKYDITIPEES